MDKRIVFLIVCGIALFLQGSMAGGAPNTGTYTGIVRLIGSEPFTEYILETGEGTYALIGIERSQLSRFQNLNVIIKADRTGDYSRRQFPQIAVRDIRVADK